MTIILIAFINSVVWTLLFALGAAVKIVPPWSIPTVFVGSFVGCLFALALVVGGARRQTEGKAQP